MDANGVREGALKRGLCGKLIRVLKVIIFTYIRPVTLNYEMLLLWFCSDDWPSVRLRA